jgi:integrase
MWLIQRQGIYYAGCYRDGKDVYVSLRTKDEVEAEAKLLAIQEHGSPQETPFTPLTEAFLKEQVGLAAHTIYLYRKSLELFTSLVNSPQELVQDNKVYAYLHNLGEQYAVATQSIHLRNVGKFLRDQGLMTKRLRRLLKPPVDTFKGRSISDAEEAAIISCGTADMAKAMLFKIETGLRVSQVWGVCHEDRGNGILRIPPHKRQKERWIVLTKKAEEALGPKKVGGRVFERWNSVSGLKKALTRAIKRAKKQGLVSGRIRPHDLRHTAASRLVKILNPVEVRDHFGWSSVALVDRYTHSSLDEIKKKLMKAP